MKNKRRLLIVGLMSLITSVGLAGVNSVTPKEQKQIFEEAENWIDNMPDGLQDRLSDAVAHALKGFESEINYFRNISDTIGIGAYPVKVVNINGGNSANIPMRLYSSIKKPQNPLPLLVYFHGGGWSMGSINTTEKFCRALASEGNALVVSVEYPLAPEKPYPSAVNTCLEAVKFIYGRAKEWGSANSLISVGGDGAGGNLALETFSKLPESIKIKSLVLFYPLLNSTGELDPNLKRKFGRGYGFDSRLWEIFISSYKSSNNSWPEKKLPPTLMISAGRDIIINEENDFSRKNNVTFISFDGALHGFITDGQQKTAFKKAVELTDQFLK